MSDTNKKLDTLLKKEWHKKFRLLSIAVVIFSVVVVAYSTGNTVNVNANVTGFHSQASGSNESYKIVAKLESGEIKIIEIPRELGVKKGSTVILNRRKTNLFGFTSYTFNMVGDQK